MTYNEFSKIIRKFGFCVSAQVIVSDLSVAVSINFDARRDVTSWRRRADGSQSQGILMIDWISTDISVQV